MLFEIKFVGHSVLQIFIHFIVLRYSEGMPTNKLRSALSHTKAGNYSWDTDHSCGLVKVIDSRIRDGVPAQLAEFPWTAAIFVTPPNYYPPVPVFSCGAAIISDYWLITAKHCFQNLNNNEYLDVYVGSNFKYETYSRKSYEIVTTFFHVEVDIALVRVKTKIIRAFKGDNYRINRICIPEYNILNDRTEEAVMAGFGQTDLLGQKESYILRKANYSILSVQDCRSRFGFPDTAVCAVADKYISCFGDSGSALVQFVDNRAVIIGVVSFHGPNSTICDKGFVHFARVSPFTGWIKSIIEDDIPADRTNRPIVLPDVPTLPQSIIPDTRVPNSTTKTIETSSESTTIPAKPAKAQTSNPLETTTSGHPLSHNISFITISLLFVSIVLI